MREPVVLAVVVLGVLAVAPPVHAEAFDPNASPGVPPSRTVPGLVPVEHTPLFDLPPVDVAALRAEDAASGGDGYAKPMRVGYPVKTDVDLARFAAWETVGDAGDVARLRVRSRGALWIVLGFGTFRPEPGEALYVYAADGSRTLGPFTHADIRRDAQLWMPPIAGDTVVVEWWRPRARSDETPNVHLGTVSHGYEPWGGIGAEDDPVLESGSCNNDVNCPLGADWQDEKRGVVNLLTNGSGYCTGSLITNTATDCRNYVLTAYHCVSTQSKASSTTFQFNFERPQCGAGIAPTDQTVSGSTLRATSSPTDFTLLEIDVEIPEAYEPFYNGWSRDPQASPEAWGIHHPSNDEKAISWNVDPLVDGQNYGPDHWRVTEWEDGTTEPGSSGSPLFDANHRVVGQLHGGTASCTSLTWDEYGKLDLSWDGGGTESSSLAPWLDPAGSDVLAADGIDGAVCRTPQPRLRYAGHVADDGQGNADGVVDPGERIVLAVDVTNGGTLGATALSGILTAETPGTVVVDDNAAWPDIAVDVTETSLAPHFTVDVDASVACGEVLVFRLDLTPAEDPGAASETFEVPTGTASVTTEYADDMEAGPGSWTSQTIEGTNAWQQTEADAASPTHSWFVEDIPTRSDAVLVMQTLAALPEGAVLRFRHRFNTESGWDGGVLEYRVDGGAWTDAGPRLTTGAYPGSINASAASNLAGRQAWLGDSGGWRDVEVDLAGLEGADVTFRWRFATDTSVSDEGWYVDDVVVEVTTYACNPPGPAVPGEASAPGDGGPFRIDKDPGGYRLTWSAPVGGGAVDDYVLYATDLFGAKSASPTCETGLGAATEAIVANLTADHGFVVVARNATGEGPYGTGSDGGERGPAGAGDVCP